jgi:hypothetical protein
MPRGVTYAQDNQVSDNATEAGPTKVHGTNPEVCFPPHPGPVHSPPIPSIFHHSASCFPNAC